VDSDPSNLIDPDGRDFIALAVICAAGGCEAAAAVIGYGAAITAGAIACIISGVCDNLFARKHEDADSCPRPPLTPEQLDERKALEQLTSEAKKAGGDSLTRGEAEVLVEWAKEQKTKGMIHDAHEPPVDFPHAHIGNQDHIPIKP